MNAATSLNNLKTSVDHLDVGNLKTVPIDLQKLSGVVDNDVVKNAKFNTLKTKVNSLKNKIPGATTLIHINQYKTDKQKIPNTSGLVTTAILNTKITEVENKTPNHDKYITTRKFNKLTGEHFAAKLKQANLLATTAFDNKLTSYNRRITSNKTKYLEFQMKLDSLITNDYRFFLDRMFSTSNDGSQNTFAYQPTLDTLELKENKGTDYVLR